MHRRPFVLLAVLASAAATIAVGTDGPRAAADTPPGGPGTAGPPYQFTTALMGQDAHVSLPDQAMITRTRHGYVYRAGQQDSHLTITLTDDGIRYDDTGTAAWKQLAGACVDVPVEVGVAAVCRVPTWVDSAHPLLAEVWPRLGDDYVDGSTLPDSVAMSVLADAGADVAHLGAGPDFFNGAMDDDQVTGGDGNDWIRTGPGADEVWGGGGDDQLVATDGRDLLLGEDGDDRLGGGAGSDRLDGGPGKDNVRCDGGHDAATTDGADRLRSCEDVTQE